MVRAHHWIVIACLLAFSALSIAGEIRFKRGGNTSQPTKAANGVPLYNMSTGVLYVGTSTAMRRIGPFESYSGPMGYDGRSIAPLSCVITDGVSQILYDETGYNPEPSSLLSRSYSVMMYNGSQRVSPLRNEWYCEAAGVLSGVATTESFAPSVSVSFVNTGRTRVVYFGTYSAATVFGGRRVCSTVMSVATTKIGATGETGQTGPPGLSTRATINYIMRNMSTQYAQPANDVWQMQPLTNYSTHYLNATRDYTGNVRWRKSGHGYEEFLSANGNEVVKIMTDGTLMLMKGGKLRLHIKNDGGVVHYRNNLPVFEILSSGKYRGPEGWPTGTKRINYTLANGFRGYTTIVGTGGSGTGMTNPYAIPGASQTFTSAAGRVRFTFYSARGLVIH